MRVLSAGDTSREAVLALPLSRLLVKLVHVPAGTDPSEFSTPLLKAVSPYPDEDLTVSCETVREDENGAVVIAAALPESAADDIGEALDAAKLSVVRIDALALGQLRGVWKAIGAAGGRRLVLMKSAECISIVVLDDDVPVEMRAITDAGDLRLEVTRSLLAAEDFAGARNLAEIIVVRTEGADAPPEAAPADGGEDSPDAPPPGGGDRFAALSVFAPVREITVGADAALIGVAERSKDAHALNALPASWVDLLSETRFKRKLYKFIGVAAGVWLFVMAVLLGVPFGYGLMTDHQKSLSKQHARQYAAVKEMKAKVDVVRKYSDHARGALEIMKALSDRLPEGITLTSWNYKRDEGVRVSGDADAAEATYAFKDAMDALADGEDGDGEKIFGMVKLNGPNAARGGYRFDLDCQYGKEEE